MSSMVSCIYCGIEVDPRKGEGDHVIPAALGEFAGDVRFRRICLSCNNRIGESEQQLLCCGPAAFFRQIVKPLPRRRNGGSAFKKGAMGAPAPMSTIFRNGHEQVVERLADDPRNVCGVDVLVVRNAKGEEHSIRLYPGMRPEQLAQRVADAGCTAVNGSYLDCDQTHWDEFGKLIGEAFPGTGIKSAGVTDPGVQTTLGRLKLTVNDHYFRALAKIAFHYYLTRNHLGYRGEETVFEPLRYFIMNGGNHIPFFRTPNGSFAFPPSVQSDAQNTSKNWSHILAGYQSGNQIAIYIQMFVGPGVLIHGDYVLLGKLPGGILLPAQTWGHMFRYSDEQPASGKAGKVSPLDPRRLPQPP